MNQNQTNKKIFRAPMIIFEIELIIIITIGVLNALLLFIQGYWNFFDLISVLTMSIELISIGLFSYTFILIRRKDGKGISLLTTISIIWMIIDFLGYAIIGQYALPYLLGEDQKFFVPFFISVLSISFKSFALLFDIIGYLLFVVQPIITYLLLYPESQFGFKPQGPTISEKFRIYFKRN